MKTIFFWAALGCGFLTGISAFADMDAASTEALQKTQDLLNNPTEREKASANDAQAQAAQNQVKALSKSTGVGEGQFYQLASEVFANVTKEANGDPAKVNEILQNAQKNPDAFFNTWTPEEKAAMEKMVGSSPSKQ